eukprot:CAMPEP_0114515460 /NCGR_PEP_ID=MMETSP0109-20121206/16751_1 /TAXON_ID=29199 /ORGANISM="Chlorarachnion reptans, Strain CCCM449" /LENGTH=361 /DNA_ID=CAMNT_0001695673 /DNA_START=70 /DNA_END=1159 /DNA_ORIENTATION=+
MPTIDPLMGTLDLPEMTREQTLSPTEAVFAPFANVMPVDHQPSEPPPKLIMDGEPLDEVFDFKVPSIMESPDSLGSSCSPIGTEIPPMKLTNINSVVKQESDSEGSEDHDSVETKSIKSEEERGIESKSTSSSESKGSDPLAKKRKRTTRKRKDTPQARRVRQENNKRAAARYRKKRKRYINELEQKVDNLNRALDRKQAENTTLQHKNTTLMKQLEYFKKLLGKNPAAKMQTALQMVVCTFAIILGVVATPHAVSRSDSDSGMKMSHHRTILSYEAATPTWDAPLGSIESWWDSFLSFDAAAIVTILRLTVHLIVGIAIICNLGTFEKKGAFRSPWDCEACPNTASMDEWRQDKSGSHHA